MAGEGFVRATNNPGQYGFGPFERKNAFDLSGIPGLGGTNGMLIGMLLQSLLPSILGPNYVSSPFSPVGQNLQMHHQTMQFFQQRQVALEMGAKQDQDYYYRMVRGVAAMHGVRFGQQQQEAARRMAKDFAVIDPIAAQMMPEFWDRMHGFKGSASVMALGLHEGGRMALDPVTGRMGLSGASAGEFAKSMFENLYRGKTEDVMQRMSGVSMGRAGLAFDEMARRGIGVEQRTPGEIKDVLARQRVARGEAPDLDQAMKDLDRLGKEKPAQLDAALRGFQSGQAANVLKSYSGAIKAVQEIFGDLGHPDAPMSQIFNALQMMTQGGTGRFNPADLARTVRETYTTAKMTRLGIDAMMGLQGELSQSATAIGLSKTFAPQAAVQAALAGHAYGQTGALAAGGWGRLSKEEFTRLSGQLSIQAAGSDQATQLGAVAFLADRFGVKKDSEAGRLARAIREGQTTYETKDGKKHSVFMAPGDYSRIMKNAGMSQADIDEARHSPHMVQETVKQYDIGNLVRIGQGALDADPVFNRMFQGVAFNALLESGMSNKEASAFSEQLGITTTQALRKAGAAGRGTWKQRQAVVQKALVPLLRRRFPKMKTEELERIAGRISTMGWGRAEEFVFTPGSGLRGFKGALGFMDLTDADVVRRANRLHQDIAGQVEMQEALKGLAQQPFISRLTEAIAGMKPGDKVQDFIAKALGGVPKGQLTKRIEARLRRLHQIGEGMSEAAKAGHKEKMERFRQEAKELGIDIDKQLAPFKEGIERQERKRLAGERGEKDFDGPGRSKGAGPRKPVRKEGVPGRRLRKPEEEAEPKKRLRKEEEDEGDEEKESGLPKRLPLRPGGKRRVRQLEEEPRLRRRVALGGDLGGKRRPVGKKPIQLVRGGKRGEEEKGKEGEPRDKMDITGRLRIEWPLNIGRLFGRSRKPRDPEQT